MWPNTDKRRLLMKSITGGKPIRADISPTPNSCIAHLVIALQYPLQLSKTFQHSHSNDISKLHDCFMNIKAKFHYLHYI